MTWSETLPPGCAIDPVRISSQYEQWRWKTDSPSAKHLAQLTCASTPLVSAMLSDDIKPTKNSPKIESNDLDPVTMPRIGTRQMGNSKGVVDGL